MEMETFMMTSPHMAIIIGDNSDKYFVCFATDVFDHRNGSMLRQWFIDDFVGGEDGIDSPYIDGFCAFINT